jgi:glycosyltransferase involved in cell wall biosynthesis
LPTAELSVLIPTYNRREILIKSLAAYQGQSARAEILEILIVDDGSTDGTGEAVSQLSMESPIRIRYIRQNNSGLAAARNHGIREAKGRLILFIDDDIIPSPCLVREHLAWHARDPDAAAGVLGLVKWAPEVRPTPFMEWLESDGVQFGYGALTRGSQVPFTSCYFCNTTLKVAFIRENGLFDQDFRAYGFEDIELGYRLSKKGFRLLYNPEAVGYHYKFVTFADACRRAELVANAWGVFRNKEAGKYVLASEKHRRANRGVRLKKLLRNCLVTILLPLRFLLDTHIQLPQRTYRWFYNFYTESKIENAVRNATPQ